MDKLLKLGAHIEILKSEYTLDSLDALDYKYISSIREIVDDDTFIIDNPTIRGRLVPLHKGEVYNIYSFIGKGIYYSTIKILSNQLEGNARTVKVSLLKPSEKYDRRAFFRLETTMDVRYLLITPENSEDFKIAVKTGGLLTMDGFQNGTTVDISGGGVKFTSKEKLPAGGMAIMHMKAFVDNKEKNYVFLGKIIVSEQHENIRQLFVHRTQFVDLKQDAREELVRFIFQCEREKLKKR